MPMTIDVPVLLRLQIQRWIAKTVLMHLSDSMNETTKNPNLLWKLCNDYERIAGHVEEWDISQMTTLPLFPVSQEE
jgi:hypothetical protein